MKQFLGTIRSDTRGAVVVEMAFALPVLTALMIGILQFALVLQASGAMRHGIGEGLRFAKVNASAPASDIEARARNSLSGIDLDGIQQLTFTRGTASGAEYGQMSIRYELTPLIPFAAIPPIELEESRRVWLPS